MKIDNRNQMIYDGVIGIAWQASTISAALLFHRANRRCSFVIASACVRVLRIDIAHLRAPRSSIGSASDIMASIIINNNVA